MYTKGLSNSIVGVLRKSYVTKYYPKVTYENSLELISDTIKVTPPILGILDFVRGILVIDNKKHRILHMYLQRVGIYDTTVIPVSKHLLTIIFVGDEVGVTFVTRLCTDYPRPCEKVKT